MNHNKSVELKKIARGRLMGNYGTVIGAYLLQLCIGTGILLIAESLSDTSTVVGSILYGAIDLIVSLIMYVFLVGQLGIYLRISCGNKVKATDVFDGFKMHPDKAIVLGLLIAVRIAVWVLPAIVAAVAYIFTNNYLILLVAGILGIAGTIKAVYVQCELSQCFYIMLDFPQYTVSEITRYSSDLMKGKVGQYFYITCSFIPMYLLSALSLGIGMLYVYPYITMTMTEYYLDLVRVPATGSSFEAIIDEQVNLIQ